MKFVGDEAGISVLHELKDTNKEYLKFLIQEARTVFNNFVDFKGKDGSAFRLTFLPKEQNFQVTRR